ncbi:FlaD/FlaE family flagellar protein [Methanococcus voltae]|uniref:Flagella protein n=1 Tax=Methanococcus voltae (strain ATCC BAA-1334 / A3) TaxID=456320 RepID=D7DUY9_METV3|nr:FlaD/FlaE family flagellar protein [Methanococcus voltae]MCS3900753.1 flagellar protein FlaD [Methanococcus voltae]
MIGKVDMDYASLEEEYMTESEMEDYLDELRHKIPSFIVELLKNNLKNRNLTRNQLNKIVNRVSDLYFGKRPEDKKAAELTNKINDLSHKLDALMKVATVSSATKVSDDIKKEIDNLDELDLTNESPEILESPKSLEEIQKIEEIDEIELSEIDTDDSIPITEEELIPEIELIENPKIQEIDSKEYNNDVVIDNSAKVESLPEDKKELNKSAGLENEVKIPMDYVEVRNMESEIANISENTRLQELPEDTLSTMLIFKWLEFLISRVGTNNLVDVLDYYYSLKWISGKSVNKLLKISKNMKYFHEDMEWKASKSMTPEDHVVSLLYIEKLAGRPISVDELEEMEREITRIKKWATELQTL